MISIVPYNTSWPEEFKKIAGSLREALGDLAIRIDHIGSTAVPGLDAKDRIDIQLTVKELSPAVEAALTQLGFSHMEYMTDHAPFGNSHQPDQWKKWVFVPPAEQRTTNLHVRIAGRANQRYALLFRDYLRNHPHSARAYAELKYRLAQNLANPAMYPDVKDPVVDLIYYAAEEWAAITNWQPGPPDA